MRATLGPGGRIGWAVRVRAGRLPGPSRVRAEGYCRALSESSFSELRDVENGRKRPNVKCAIAKAPPNGSNPLPSAAPNPEAVEAVRRSTITNLDLDAAKAPTMMACSPKTGCYHGHPNEFGNISKPKAQYPPPPPQKKKKKRRTKNHTLQKRPCCSQVAAAKARHPRRRRGYPFNDACPRAQGLTWLWMCYEGAKGLPKPDALMRRVQGFKFRVLGSGGKGVQG